MQEIQEMHVCPRPEIELMSPALAGRFFTIVPPEKPSFNFLDTQVQSLDRKDPLEKEMETHSSILA